MTFNEKGDQDTGPWPESFPVIWDLPFPL